MLKPLLVFMLCSTFAVTHSQVFRPNSEKTIHNTCIETPRYEECKKYLTDDPKGATADVYGLALIMLNVVKDKTNSGLNKINQLIESGSSTDQKEALKSCADIYNKIAADIPPAIEGLQNKKAKLGMDSTYEASSTVAKCEAGFSKNSSPFSTESEVLGNAFIITAHICRQLYLGGGRFR